MKIVKVFIGFLGVALFGFVAYNAVLLAQTVNFSSPISIDPIVSGVHVAGLKRDELMNLSHNPAQVEINLVDKSNMNETVSGSTIVENPVSDKVFKTTIKNNALKQNNTIFPVSLIGMDVRNASDLIYDKEHTDSSIANLGLFNRNTVPTTSANVTYNERTGQFEEVPESVGTEVDKHLLVSRMIDVLNYAHSNNEDINLAGDNLYKRPKITYGSKQLNNIVNLLNNSLGSVITYKIGDYSYSAPASVYGTWIQLLDTGEIYVDQERLKNYFSNIGYGFNIYGSKNEALSEKRIMTAYLVNYEDEADQTRAAILNHQNATRVLERCSITIDDIAPIYTQENQARLDELHNQLGPEFVYINIPQQFMWYYKDNNLMVATPITSGQRYNHDTPTGLYELQYKALNVTLKGNNDDGSKYESPVVYWMPFNGGIGIHDADNWRSTSGYGGETYTYNGSHGCVNTPRDKCAIIYNNISVDCPIMVD